MIIRIAKQHDLAAMVAIYNQAIAAGQKTADTKPVHYDDRQSWFDEHPANCYPILVAEENNNLAGYLTISAYRSGRMALRYTAEVSYYVHTDYQRQGVASELLKQAITLCPKLKIKTLFAILMDSNVASIRLLEKQGFKQWGHLPDVAEFDDIVVGQFYYGLKIIP